MSIDGWLPTQAEIDDLHQRIRADIVSCCTRNGYGCTIDQAARAWAARPDMTAKHMATWLRGLADQLDPPTTPEGTDDMSEQAQQRMKDRRDRARSSLAARGFQFPTDEAPTARLLDIEAQRLDEYAEAWRYQKDAEEEMQELRAENESLQAVRATQCAKIEALKSRVAELEREGLLEHHSIARSALRRIANDIAVGSPTSSVVMRKIAKEAIAQTLRDAPVEAAAVRGPSDLERKVDEALTGLMVHARLERERPFHRTLRESLEICPAGDCDACKRALAAFDKDEPSTNSKANALELIKITGLLARLGYDDARGELQGLSRIARIEQIYTDLRHAGERLGELETTNRSLFESLERARDRNLNAYGEAERDIIHFIATTTPQGILETTAKVLLKLTSAIAQGEHRPNYDTDESPSPPTPERICKP